MAQISGGVSGNIAEVDATPSALRVIQYDSGGNELNKPSTGSYCLAINPGRITGTPASTANLFAFRNAGAAAKTIFIRRIRLMVAFDGTAAASTAIYNLFRFDTADMSGGTTLTLPGAAVKKRTSYGSSVLGDARQGVAALTVGSAAVAAWPFGVAALSRGLSGGANVFEMEFHSPDEAFDCFELAAGEGFVIQLGATGVIGDSFSGFVEWDETA